MEPTDVSKKRDKDNNAKAEEEAAVKPWPVWDLSVTPWPAWDAVKKEENKGTSGTLGGGRMSKAEDPDALEPWPMWDPIYTLG